MSMYYGYQNGYAVYRRVPLYTVAAVSSGSFAGSYSSSFASSYSGSFTGTAGSLVGSGMSGSLTASPCADVPDIILGYGIDLI